MFLLLCNNQQTPSGTLRYCSDANPNHNHDPNPNPEPNPNPSHVHPDNAQVAVTRLAIRTDTV